MLNKDEVYIEIKHAEERRILKQINGRFAYTEGACYYISNGNQLNGESHGTDKYQEIIKIRTKVDFITFLGFLDKTWSVKLSDSDSEFANWLRNNTDVCGRCPGEYYYPDVFENGVWYVRQKNPCDFVLTEELFLYHIKKQKQKSKVRYYFQVKHEEEGTILNEIEHFSYNIGHYYFIDKGCIYYLCCKQNIDNYKNQEAFNRNYKEVNFLEFLNHLDKPWYVQLSDCGSPFSDWLRVNTNTNGSSADCRYYPMNYNIITDSDWKCNRNKTGIEISEELFLNIMNPKKEPETNIDGCCRITVNCDEEARILSTIRPVLVTVGDVYLITPDKNIVAVKPKDIERVDAECKDINIFEALHLLNHGWCIQSDSNSTFCKWLKKNTNLTSLPEGCYYYYAKYGDLNYWSCFSVKPVNTKVSEELFLNTFGIKEEPALVDVNELDKLNELEKLKQDLIQKEHERIKRFEDASREHAEYYNKFVNYVKETKEAEAEAEVSKPDLITEILTKGFSI